MANGPIISRIDGQRWIEFFFRADYAPTLRDGVRPGATEWPTGEEGGPQPYVAGDTLYSAIPNADSMSTGGGLRIEPIYDPSRQADTPDLAAIAGLVYGTGNMLGDGLAYNNRMWGSWRGRNGKWYPDRWGGNGATGGRSVAISRGAAWKFLLGQFDG